MDTPTNILNAQVVIQEYAIILPKPSFIITIVTIYICYISNKIKDFISYLTRKLLNWCIYEKADKCSQF